MAVSGIGNNYPDTVSSNASSKASNELGKDAFLKLLVAQMQNQDPMNPTEDKEFISQLATFSTVEQLQSLNSSMQTTQAAALIGKQVTWSDSGGYYYGTVHAVRVDGTNVYVVVGEGNKTIELQLSDVVLIENPKEIPKETPKENPKEIPKENPKETQSGNNSESNTGKNSAG